MQTEQAMTMIAMIAPLDRVNDPPSGPAAPASLSPLPAVDPTSPADGPSHNQYCVFPPFLSECKTHHFLVVQALRSPGLKIQTQQSWKTFLESERQLMLELAEKKL